jgi:hypothetical protein
MAVIEATRELHADAAESIRSLQPAAPIRSAIRS